MTISDSAADDPRPLWLLGQPRLLGRHALVTFVGSSKLAGMLSLVGDFR
jgi:hypothetical protein